MKRSLTPSVRVTVAALVALTGRLGPDRDFGARHCQLATDPEVAYASYAGYKWASVDKPGRVPHSVCT